MNVLPLKPREISTTGFVPSGGKVVLSARGLRKAFGGQVVLNDVSLELRQGEVVLLRGENGSGKTTLLNILTGNLEPDKGELRLNLNGTKEAFSFPRPWWKELNPFDHFTPERLAWEGIGRVWQDVRLFPTMKALENVAVAFPKHTGENPALALIPQSYKSEKKNLEAASLWLDNLGLGDRLHSSCDKISLGQMKRVAIARAAQAGAKVLFLDEPLSGLDDKGISETIYHLKALVAQHAITIVIVEHSFNFKSVIGLVNTVWTLSKNEDYEGGYQLSASEPHVLNLENKGGNTFGHILNEFACSNGISKPDRLPGGATLTTYFSLGQEANPILEINNLIIKRGIQTIFERADDTQLGDNNGLSMTLKQGQVAILEAPNGWGKSTLLDAVTRVHNNNLAITAGSVVLKGRNISSLQAHQISRMGLSYLRSNNKAFSSLKVKHQKELGRSCKSLFRSSLDGNRKGGSLSGGENQRLLIDLLPAADVYLLDEPMIGLDEASIKTVCNWIINMAKDGKAILITIPCNSGGEYH